MTGVRVGFETRAGQSLACAASPPDSRWPLVQFDDGDPWPDAISSGNIDIDEYLFDQWKKGIAANSAL